MKVCSKCKTKKLIVDFYKNKSTKDKLFSWCKECSKKSKRLYDQSHKKEISIKGKKYREINKERIKNYRDMNKKKIKKHRDCHKEEMKQYNKEYYQKNKQKLLQQAKIYRNCHKEEQSKQGKKYYKIHKKELIKKANKYNKKRRKFDINFKIRCNLRSRIWHALKGNVKSLSTMFLTGCSVEYLMYYLQCKFTKGMNWDNYGYYGWHIDHIKPCSSFDLSKPSEQRKCFHYTNLQPLWAEDNRIKKARMKTRK